MVHDRYLDGWATRDVVNGDLPCYCVDEEVGEMGCKNTTDLCGWRSRGS